MATSEVDGLEVVVEVAVTVAGVGVTTIGGAVFSTVLSRFGRNTETSFLADTAENA